MLVINRRKNQEVVVGDDIRVVILGVKKNKVKFGVYAPPEVSIARRTGSETDSAKANIAVADPEPAEQELPAEGRAVAEARNR